MLYLYSHTERGAARNERQKQETAAKKKNEIVRFNDTNFSREEFEKYLGAADLFGDSFAIFCDRMLANTEAKEFFWEKLDELASSPNIFHVFEEKFSADEIKLLKKAGAELVEDKTKPIKPKGDFNIFALSDALGARDRKGLWVLYQQALRVGKSAEEINGALFWTIKSMLAVRLGGGKTLNPYVKSKATGFLKNYPNNEIDDLAFSLVKNYHDSRRGGLPLEERLERFILSL
jgi:hypothetical protein